MSRNMVLEVCLDSVESAIISQEAGASRIELCANLSEGGTTPSLGCVLVTRQCLQIPIHVIIRPRGGDFCYSDHEFEVMKSDISAMKQAGVDGVVLGILNPDGSVDMQRTKELVDLARPMSVTFHRAFDLTRNPYQALEDVIQTGAERILTSGQQPTAIEGIPLIIKLIEQAQDRIIIMPGAGIKEGNIRYLLESTLAREIHLSAGTLVSGKMQFRPTTIKLNSTQTLSEYDLRRTDFEQIKHILGKELV